MLSVAYYNKKRLQKLFIKATPMAQKWRKALYVKQNYPDNYVDPSFLSELRKNVDLYNFTYTEAVMGVCSVTNELSCTVIFFMIFWLLKYQLVPVPFVIFGPTTLVVPFSVFQLLSSRRDLSRTELCKACLKNVVSCVVFLFFGYMFSPVFHVLTETISTDTIYAMVVGMLIVHVVFQNYGTEGPIVSPSLSLNSAIFAAVCLSSRLPTVTHTFILIMSAVQIFILLPILRQKVMNNSLVLSVMTITFTLVAIGVVYYVTPVCAIILFLLCLFITFICPYVFVHSQKYKETIFGPWDEAVVKLD